MYSWCFPQVGSDGTLQWLSAHWQQLSHRKHVSHYGAISTFFFSFTLCICIKRCLHEHRAACCHWFSKSDQFWFTVFYSRFPVWFNIVSLDLKDILNIFRFNAANHSRRPPSVALIVNVYFENWHQGGCISVSIWMSGSHNGWLSFACQKMSRTLDSEFCQAIDAYSLNTWRPGC